MSTILTRAPRSLFATADHSARADLDGANILRIGAPRFAPESVRLSENASAVSRRAVARMVSAHTRGVYSTRYLAAGPFVAEYETWYWLNAVVAGATPTVDGRAVSVKAKRDAAAEARKGGDERLAVELELEAAEIERMPPPRRGAGRRSDSRRGFGGFGGFVLLQTGIDKHDRGLSYDDVAELIYSAEDDWLPFAPVTDAMLRATPGGWSQHQIGGRGRLLDALRTAAAVEAKRQNVKRARGRRR